MKTLSIWLGCAFLLCGCEAKVKSVPATEVVARIDAEPAVLAALASLQIRTATEQDGAWVDLDSKTFEVGDLRWPVDIVLTPRSEASAGSYFEVVVDALDANGDRLVEARALSAFALREARVLPIRLEACGSQPLGFVCELQADCYGPECQTCVAAGCKPTPMTSSDLLAPLELDAGSARVEDAGGHDAKAPDARVVPQDDDGPTDGGPTSCPSGYSADSEGGCVDTDECALNLDDCNDAPDACSNLVGTFLCKCPAGYDGAGRGAGSCVDIDECKNGTAQCDALVACHNVPGSYMCGTCPPGYTGGAGGTCMDANECLTNNGGCSTSPMATCKNQVGAPNTCTCPSGYTGSGVGAGGCTNADDCASKPCQNGGTCADGLNSYTCSCPAAYTGKNCELQICTTMTIKSLPDLVAARLCAVVQGDLHIASEGFATIAPGDLPNLRQVTGSLTISAYSGSGGDNLQTATFTSLQTVGSLALSPGADQLDAVHFPALTAIGNPGQTGLGFQLPAGFTRVLDLPMLATVEGDFQVGEVAFSSLPELCSVSLGRVSKITGTVTISHVPNTAASAWDAVRRSSSNSSNAYTELGCCIYTDQYQCSNFSTTTLTGGMCGVAGGCQ